MVLAGSDRPFNCQVSHGLDRERSCRPPTRTSLSDMAVHPYLRNSTAPLAIAHRGGAHEAPENTREAFEYATSLGFRYLETDAQITRDGVVVAFHDDKVDRVSDQTGKISSWDWADLKQVAIGGAAMISVEELLEEFPDSFFNIDAKSDAVLAPLLDVLARTEAFERVCVGSFSDERLRRARQAQRGNLCTSFGPRGTLRCVLSSYGLPIEPPLGNALQLPPTYRGVPLLTPRLIDHAHSLGLFVHAWTIDDAFEMDRLLDMGVDGIMTDRPTVLKDVFTSRGLSL